MTETQNRQIYKVDINSLYVPSRKELHKHYGGEIYPYDFNTDYKGKENKKGSVIASRIASEMRL